MRTEWLNEWEMLAVVHGLKKLVTDGCIHEKDGKKLLEKLDLATHIRLTLPN